MHCLRVGNRRRPTGNFGQISRSWNLLEVHCTLFCNSFLLTFPPPIWWVFVHLMPACPFAMWLFAYYYICGLGTYPGSFHYGKFSLWVLATWYIWCPLPCGYLRTLLVAAGYVPWWFPLCRIVAARLGGLESCDPTGDQVLCWEGIFCNGPKESTFNWLSLCAWRFSILGLTKKKKN